MKHVIAKIGLVMGAVSIAGSASATNIQMHANQFVAANANYDTCVQYNRDGLRNAGCTDLMLTLGAVQSFENAYYDVYVDGENVGSVRTNDITFCAYDYQGNLRKCQTVQTGGTRGKWTAHYQFTPSQAYGGYMSVEAIIRGDVKLFGAGVYHW